MSRIPLWRKNAEIKSQQKNHKFPMLKIFELWKPFIGEVVNLPSSTRIRNDDRVWFMGQLERSSVSSVQVTLKSESVCTHIYTVGNGAAAGGERIRTADKWNIWDLHLWFEEKGEKYFYVDGTEIRCVYESIRSN